MRSVLRPACVAALLVTASAASAKTFVFPHLLEASGKITNTPFTSETTLFMTYTPGLADVPLPRGRREPTP